MAEELFGEKLYWLGPYNVLVPQEVESVPNPNGTNHVGPDVTNVEGSGSLHNTMSRVEYRRRYARKGEDGLYFWREEGSAKC
jgi:hypothetical protein